MFHFSLSLFFFFFLSWSKTWKRKEWNWKGKTEQSEYGNVLTFTYNPKYLVLVHHILLHSRNSIQTLVQHRTIRCSRNDYEYITSMHWLKWEKHLTGYSNVVCVCGGVLLLLSPPSRPAVDSNKAHRRVCSLEESKSIVWFWSLWNQWYATSFINWADLIFLCYEHVELYDMFPRADRNRYCHCHCHPSVIREKITELADKSSLKSKWFQSQAESQ